jgi:hypothetical protein
MKSLVDIRYARPPHALVADLPQAFNVDRLLTRAGRGQFAFNLPTSSLHREVIQEGRIVVIQSTEAILPYVGVVTKAEEDAGARTVEVSGDNYASVLYNAALDRTAPVSNQGAGKIAERLLAEAQGIGRSMFVTVGSAVGSHLAGSMDFGAQLLGQALDALADRVGDEWWLDHLVTRRTLETRLYWARRRGVTRTDVLLQEGKDFTVAEYKRDVGTARTAIAVGGGGEIGGRASVAVGSDPTGRGSQVAVLGTRPSPLVAKDAIELRPLDTDPTTLSEIAQRMFEKPLIASESLALTATITAAEHLRPGDTVQARFHSINYGGMQRQIRIMAMQPDEDSAECDLDVEVV